MNINDYKSMWCQFLDEIGYIHKIHKVGKTFIEIDVIPKGKSSSWKSSWAIFDINVNKNEVHLDFDIINLIDPDAFKKIKNALDDHCF